MSLPVDHALSIYPRLELIRTPTPLTHLPHLSAWLGLQIYIKRDDLTDLALGGDKPRKLEYELVKARDAGATVLVTCGSAQSNSARLMSAAARKLGMKAAVVLSGDEYRTFQGNLLTLHLMDTRIVFVDTDDHWALEPHAMKLCDELRAAGEIPYYVEVSATTPTSCLGYVRAGLEIADQLDAEGVRLDAVYTPFGTGGIFTSILFALRERGIDCPVIGISVNARLDRCRENFERWWTGISELLDRDPTRPRGPHEIHDRFIGREYGDAIDACLDALMLMAETEGILLDPVYSGKVFSGLCGHHADGRWRPGQRVLLLHSGGTPAIFAYHDEIRRHLIKRGRQVAV